MELGTIIVVALIVLGIVVFAFNSKAILTIALVVGIIVVALIVFRLLTGGSRRSKHGKRHRSGGGMFDGLDDIWDDD